MKFFFGILWLLGSLGINLSIGGPGLQLEPQVGTFSSTINRHGSLSSGGRALLPSSVIPHHYDLDIRPIIDSTESDQFTAPGIVVITVNATQATNSITLHSSEILIQESGVKVEDVGSGDVWVVEGISYNETEETMSIQLGASLTGGEQYLVTIPFVAQVGNRLDGLYRSSYVAQDGSTRWVATTQFEDISARLAFPCFDEPALKATFRVRIGRKEAVHHSLFCTEKEGQPIPIDGLPGWVWDTHALTTQMSTYLLGIVVSDFVSVSAPQELYRLNVKTWGPPTITTNASGEFSAMAVANVLNFYEEYLDIPYQLNKMDSVAMPDFSAGAMENWGINIYRVPYMLWFEGESTVREQWQQASVIAHEVAHQWFGNLVTMKWWNDIWLNEGFANYMENIGAANVGKDFGSIERTILNQAQLAMDFDVTSGTKPVHSNVTNELVGQPSRIIYEKAGSLIRMMNAFLTEQTFITGIQKYLKKHQFSNTVQDDLFAELTEQGHADETLPLNTTVKEIMDTWTLQTGFPLLYVEISADNEISFTQSKFVKDPSQEDPTTTWIVPVAYVTKSNSEINAGSLQPKFWMDQNTVLATEKVENSMEWILVNPDFRSYYRVMYDHMLTNMLLDQLIENHTVISPSSRAQLFDDHFKAANEKFKIDHALNFTLYLQNEDDLVVWTSVFNSLRPIYLLLSDSSISDAFKEYLLSKVLEPLDRIGFYQLPRDPPVEVLLRIQLLDWACSLGLESCRTFSAAQVTNWIPNPDSNPIPTDVQPMVYCAAITSGSAPIRDFITEEYKKNRSTRQRELLRNALACSEDETILLSLINDALNNSSDITRGDAVPLLQKIADNSQGRRLLFGELKTRSFDFVTSLGASSVSNILTTITQYVSSANTSSTVTPSEVESFVTLFKAANPDLPQSVINSLNASLTKVTTNSVWVSSFYEDVQTWIQAQK